jgi:hypothetical protein
MLILCCKHICILTVFIVFDKTQESDESESEIDDEVSGHVLIM